MAPMASAQNHVIGKSALDKAVQQRVSREQADREAILSLLQRAEVRDIAAKAGLSLDKAPAAVSTLQGTDLAQAAAQARQVQNDLAGGASDDRDLDDHDHHRPASRHRDHPSRRLTALPHTCDCRRRQPDGGGDRARSAGAQARDGSLHLLDVPYLPQSEALCGGAAVAMVMRYWGAANVYAETFADLVDRAAEGIRGEDLLQRASVARLDRPRRFAVMPALVQTSSCATAAPSSPSSRIGPDVFTTSSIVGWSRGRVIASRSGSRAVPRPRRQDVQRRVDGVRLLDAGRRHRRRPGTAKVAAA